MGTSVICRRGGSSSSNSVTLVFITAICLAFLQSKSWSFIVWTVTSHHAVRPAQDLQKQKQIHIKPTIPKLFSTNYVSRLNPLCWDETGDFFSAKTILAVYFKKLLFSVGLNSCLLSKFCIVFFFVSYHPRYTQESLFVGYLELGVEPRNPRYSGRYSPVRPKLQ